MDNKGRYGRTNYTQIFIFILSLPIVFIFMFQNGIFDTAIDSLSSRQISHVQDVCEFEKQQIRDINVNAQINHLDDQVAALKITNQEQKREISDLKNQVGDFKWGYIFFGMAIGTFIWNYISDYKRKTKLKKLQRELNIQEERISAKGSKNYKDDSDKSSDIKGVKLQG